MVFGGRYRERMKVKLIVGRTSGVGLMSLALVSDLGEKKVSKPTSSPLNAGIYGCSLGSSDAHFLSIETQHQPPLPNISYKCAVV